MRLKIWIIGTIMFVFTCITVSAHDPPQKYKIIDSQRYYYDTRYRAYMPQLTPIDKAAMRREKITAKATQRLLKKGSSSVIVDGKMKWWDFYYN